MSTIQKWFFSKYVVFSQFFVSYCVATTLFITVPLLADVDTLSNMEYIFRTGVYHENHMADLNETHEILLILKEKTPCSIYDNELPPYSNICSNCDTAVALDFLARYLNECQNLVDEEEIILHIEKFKLYYEIYTPTFVTREHAFHIFEWAAFSSFNTALPDLTKLNSETLKYRKLQAIANYHKLIIEPVTQNLKKRDIKHRKVNLKKIIENLPMAAYIIKGTDPVPSDSKDAHIMILIKNKKISIIYDHNEGALQINKKPARITEKLGEYLEEILIDEPFLEFRIYKATCGKDGCTNLSTEICDSLNQ